MAKEKKEPGILPFRDMFKLASPENPNWEFNGKNYDRVKMYKIFLKGFTRWGLSGRVLNSQFDLTCRNYAIVAYEAIEKFEETSGEVVNLDKISFDKIKEIIHEASGFKFTKLLLEHKVPNYKNLLKKLYELSNFAAMDNLYVNLFFTEKGSTKHVASLEEFKQKNKSLRSWVKVLAYFESPEVQKSLGRAILPIYSQGFVNKRSLVMFIVLGVDLSKGPEFSIRDIIDFHDNFSRDPEEWKQRFELKINSLAQDTEILKELKNLAEYNETIMYLQKSTVSFVEILRIISVNKDQMSEASKIKLLFHNTVRYYRMYGQYATIDDINRTLSNTRKRSGAKNTQVANDINNALKKVSNNILNDVVSKLPATIGILGEGQLVRLIYFAPEKVKELCRRIIGDIEFDEIEQAIQKQYSLVELWELLNKQGDENLSAIAMLEFLNSKNEYERDDFSIAFDKVKSSINSLPPEAVFEIITSANQDVFAIDSFSEKQLLSIYLLHKQNYRTYQPSKKVVDKITDRGYWWISYFNSPRIVSVYQSRIKITDAEELELGDFSVIEDANVEEEKK